jgi:putative copper export protein
MLEALAAAAKGVLYAGLLSGTGTVLAVATLRCVPGIVPFSLRVIKRGALFTIAAALSGALLLILRLGGQFDAPTLSAVFLSGSGAAISLQLAGSILLLSVMGEDTSARVTRLSYAVLTLLSLAVYGHAATAGGQEAAVALVHVSAAAWWLGSLWLLRHSCTHLEPGNVAELLGKFSAQALYLIGGLALAGIVLLLSLVDFAQQPWLSPYGQVFAIKLGLFVLILGLASYNRVRLTPFVLAGNPIAIASLRRMVEFELVLIGALLATTAILTTYASPPEILSNAADLAAGTGSLPKVPGS